MILNGGHLRDKIMENEAVTSKNVKVTSKWKLFDLAYFVLIAAVIIAVIFILKLSKQNALLQSRLQEPSGTLTGPPSAQPGDLVPAFKSVDLAGQPADLVFDGTKKTLIFIFSPACDVCSHEIPTWSSIAKQVASKNCIVRGISLDSLETSKESLKNQELQFETLIMPSMSIRRSYRVISIPQTMIVSAQGTIEWVYYGGLTKDKVTELLSRIDENP